MTDRRPLFDQEETPEDVATLYSWANLHGAKYRDFSASRALAREKARLRVMQAIEEEKARAHHIDADLPAAQVQSLDDLDRAADMRRMAEVARAQEEAHLVDLAEQRATRDAALRAEREAAEAARRESEEWAARQAAEQAAREAAERAQREAEEQEMRRAQEMSARWAAERAAREAEEQARREAEENARREAEELAARQAAEQAAREAEEQARREAEENARREAEELAARQAAEQAAREAEEQARREAEEKARREAEELAARQAAEQAAREAEEQAKREAEEKVRREFEELAARHAAEQAAREAEEQARREAEEKARREAEELAARQAAEQAAREAEDQARREAEEKARREAEELAAREAEEQAKRQAAEQAMREAARLQAEQRAQQAAQKLAAQRAEQEKELQATRIAAEKAAQHLAAQRAALHAQAAKDAAERAAEEAARQAEKQAARQAAELAAQKRTPVEAAQPVSLPHSILDRLPIIPAAEPAHSDLLSEALPKPHRPEFPDYTPFQPKSPVQPLHASIGEGVQPQPRNPWVASDPLDNAGRPAWLTPERPEAPAQPAAPKAPEESLQGSRDRLASRWFALRGVFDGAGSPAETAPAPVAARAPVVAVFSLAGGVGKTSLVATLGRALSARGERVLLVDTAPYGLLPFFFGARDQRPGLLRTFSPPGNSGDAPIQMVTIDPEGISPDAANQDALSGEIGTYSRGSSRVIVDLATASGATTRRILRMSPLVLVPLVPDMNSVVSFSSIDSFFQHNGTTSAKSLPYYVLNQFDPSLPLHLDIREVLREQLGDRLLPFVLRRAPAVSEALAEGMTVMDYAPSSTVAEDFGNLASWVKTQSAPATSVYRGVRWSER